MYSISPEHTDISDVYQIGKAKIMNAYQREFKTLRFKKLINAVCQRVIEKDTLRLTNEDYKELIGKIYHQRDDIQVKRLRRLLNMPEALELKDKTLQQVMLSKGYTMDKYAELLQKAEEIATDKQQASVLIQVADRVEKFVNIEKAESTPTTTVDFVQLRKNAEGDTIKVKQSYTVPKGEQ